MDRTPLLFLLFFFFLIRTTSSTHGSSSSRLFFPLCLPHRAAAPPCLPMPPPPPSPRWLQCCLQIHTPMHPCPVSSLNQRALTLLPPRVAALLPPYASALRRFGTLCVVPPSALPQHDLVRRQGQADQGHALGHGNEKEPGEALFFGSKCAFELQSTDFAGSSRGAVADDPVWYQEP
jgi:hypothetical protein